MKPARGMAGYTLVELLVVLTIIGLLATTAMPLLSASHPGLEAKAAVRALASDLVAARQAAIDAGVAQRVVLNPSMGRYILPGGAKRTLPKELTLGFQGAVRNEIDFYPDGSASGGIILVSAPHARLRVTVAWPGGQIAVDD